MCRIDADPGLLQLRYGLCEVSGIQERYAVKGSHRGADGLRIINIYGSFTHQDPIDSGPLSGTDHGSQVPRILNVLKDKEQWSFPFLGLPFACSPKKIRQVIGHLFHQEKNPLRGLGIRQLPEYLLRHGFHNSSLFLTGHELFVNS